MSFVHVYFEKKLVADYTRENKKERLRSCFVTEVRQQKKLRCLAIVIFLS